MLMNSLIRQSLVSSPFSRWHCTRSVYFNISRSLPRLQVYTGQLFPSVRDFSSRASVLHSKHNPSKKHADDDHTESDSKSKEAVATTSKSKDNKQREKQERKEREQQKKEIQRQMKQKQQEAKAKKDQMRLQ